MTTSRGIRKGFVLIGLLTGLLLPASRAAPPAPIPGHGKPILRTVFSSMTWTGTRFVLCDDDTVLFRSKSSPSGWRWTEIKSDERERLMSSAKKMNGLNQTYDMTDGRITCQSVGIIEWFDAAGAHKISVTGCRMDQCAADLVPADRKPPAQFQSLYDETNRFAGPGKPWIPKDFIVILREPSPDAAIENWPRQLLPLERVKFANHPKVNALRVRIKYPDDKSGAIALFNAQNAGRNILADGKTYQIEIDLAARYQNPDNNDENAPDFDAEPSN